MRKIKYYKTFNNEDDAYNHMVIKNLEAKVDGDKEIFVTFKSRNAHLVTDLRTAINRKALYRWSFGL